MASISMSLLLYTIVIYSYQGVASEDLKVLYEWTTLNFEKPDKLDQYELMNMTITSIKRYKNKIYLALPRIKLSVPITMAWIPEEPVDGNKSPLLKPFPSRHTNLVADACGSSIRSVNGFEIDKDGIMWVIDSGKNGTLMTANSASDCPPSLIFIDLKKTNPEIISRHVIPKWVANSSSYLIDIVVDDNDGGFAYITDGSTDPGIIVYARKRNKFWKFTHRPSMEIDPKDIAVTIGNYEFWVKYRINGIALGPQYLTSSNELIRNVYYAPIASRSIYVISSATLKNEIIGDSRLTHKHGDDYYGRYVGTIGRKSAQTVGMIADADGRLYYGMLGKQKINSWKEDTSNWDFVHGNSTWSDDNQSVMKGQEFLKNDKFRWIERFEIDDNGNLYILSTNFHRFVSDIVDPKAIHFRIFKTNIGVKKYLHGKDLTNFEPYFVGKVAIQCSDLTSFDDACF